MHHMGADWVFTLPDPLCWQVQADLSCVPASWKGGSPLVWVSAVHFLQIHTLTTTEHRPKCQTFNLRSRWTGLLQVVKQYVKIPVYVMIRPRGGDFLYSDQEVEVMKKDIELMKSHGADGLVLGALNEDGHVDTELCMEFMGNVCWFVFSFLLSWCWSKNIFTALSIIRLLFFLFKCSFWKWIHFHCLPAMLCTFSHQLLLDLCLSPSTEVTFLFQKFWRSY